MSTLKVGVHVVPNQPDKHPCHPLGNIILIDRQRKCILEAELLDINPRFCRLRIARERVRFDPGKVRLQFAWTNVFAHIIWTNTHDDFVELGLLLLNS